MQTSSALANTHHTGPGEAHALAQHLAERTQLDHQRAASQLEHAMAYLMLHWLRRTREERAANQQAVQILCDARDILDQLLY